MCPRGKPTTLSDISELKSYHNPLCDCTAAIPAAIPVRDAVGVLSSQTESGPRQEKRRTRNRIEATSRKRSTSCFGGLLRFLSKGNGWSKLLPPVARQDAGKPCLVLDLDGTLVHCEQTPMEDYDFKDKLSYHGQEYNLYFKKRPFCDHFLTQAAQFFELVVFTAADEQYAGLVLEHLDPSGLVSHCLHRSHCSKDRGCGEPVLVKDLERLGRNLEECIILDNDPKAYKLQPENAIPINSWFTDKQDNDLRHVLGILDRVVSSTDTAVSVLGALDKKLGWRRKERSRK